VQAGADWPARLAAQKGDLPVVPVVSLTGSVRRGHRFVAVRERIADCICGGAIGGTRLDNLVCDGFLPLLAAETGGDLNGLWFHWFPGDLPPTLQQSLRRLGAVGGRDWPASHGLGQGLLGWLLEREQQEAAESGRGA
jgi:hypothetical protein